MSRVPENLWGTWHNLVGAGRAVGMSWACSSAPGKGGGTCGGDWAGQPAPATWKSSWDPGGLPVLVFQKHIFTDEMTCHRKLAPNALPCFLVHECKHFSRIHVHGGCGGVRPLTLQQTLPSCPFGRFYQHIIFKNGVIIPIKPNTGVLAIFSMFARLNKNHTLFCFAILGFPARPSIFGCPFV